MKLEDQVLLSFYQDISPLADNPRIMLVRHVETGQIVVHIVSTDVAPAKEFRQIYIVLRHIFVEVIGKTIISIFRILL